MRILFLGMSRIDTLQTRGIYTDLLRGLAENPKNEVVILTPIERRNHLKTFCKREGNTIFLEVRTGNLQKCGTIEKGFSQLLISRKFLRAIKKYCQDPFDLVLYPTPPITFSKAVSSIKKRDHAKTYLMLKDIFPQNAIDLGLLTHRGMKGLLTKYYQRLEKKLYQVSDYIGCMSPRNKEYLLEKNPWLDPRKVELFPNAICSSPDSPQRTNAGKTEAIEFLYGGNLGKPQGIPFLLSCIEACKTLNRVHFTICGTGTELPFIETYVHNHQLSNLTVIPGLSHDQYEAIVSNVDVGLIFLDYRFTIPNYPSRLLSYLNAGVPVFACTDTSSDVGKFLIDNECGWFCPSNDVDAFVQTVKKIQTMEKVDLLHMGENGYQALVKYFDVKKEVQRIQNLC